MQILERENGTVLEIGQPVLYVSMDLNESYTDHYAVITDIDKEITGHLICNRKGEETDVTITRPATWWHPVTKGQLSEAKDIYVMNGSYLLKEVIKLVEMYNKDREVRQQALFEEENVTRD